MVVPGRRRLRSMASRVRFPLRGRLLRARLRLHERRLERAAPHDGPSTGPPGETPLPPARLRALTVPSFDAGYFLTTGRFNYEQINALLLGAGADPGSLGAVLDFGCGCGRVARWWPAAGGPELHGCDYNPELAGWCERNLPAISVRVNGLQPPLPYPDARFDLVYALSIFTHLPGPEQGRWVLELARVLAPGGYLCLTVAGEAQLDRLSPRERRAFARGEPVIQFEEMAGTNVCAAFHPRTYVEETLLGGLELVAEEPGSAPGAQDAYLARRS
jgi:SAM-dependent methyltransferase